MVGIVLINPPSPENTEYVRVERCMQKKSAWAGSLWQPLQLMYAQSILEKNGYKSNTDFRSLIGFMVEYLMTKGKLFPNTTIEAIYDILDNEIDNL